VRRASWCVSLLWPFFAGCEYRCRIRNCWRTSRRRGIFFVVWKACGACRGGRRIFSKERVWRWLGATCFPMWSCWRPPCLLAFWRARKWAWAFASWLATAACSRHGGSPLHSSGEAESHASEAVHTKALLASWTPPKTLNPYIIAYEPDRVISNSAQIFDRTRPAEPLFINF